MNIKKNLVKSIIPGIYISCIGMILQVGKGILILKGGPPKISFIAIAAISYFLMAYFFAFGFFTFYEVVPGRTRIRKAFIYSVSGYFCAFLPGLFGVAGFDFQGGADLLAPGKIDTYAIAITDMINLVAGGTLLGLFIKKENYDTDFPERNNRLLIASLIGLILYPLLSLVTHLFLEQFIDYGYTIPQNLRVFHFSVIYGLLAITGFCMPAFYTIANRKLKGSNFNKVMVFSIFFFLSFWFMNIGFLIAFGYSVKTTCLFWAESIISILVTTSIVARITVKGQIK